MALEVTSVTWDNWWNTDILSVTIFFKSKAKDGLVGEFEVPNTEDEKYMLMYNQNPDIGEYIWVQVINPSGYITANKPEKGRIPLIVNGQEMPLIDFVKEIV